MDRADAQLQLLHRLHGESRIDFPRRRLVKFIQRTGQGVVVQFVSYYALAEQHLDVLIPIELPHMA